MMREAYAGATLAFFIMRAGRPAPYPSAASMRSQIASSTRTRA